MAFECEGCLQGTPIQRSFLVPGCGECNLSPLIPSFGSFGVIG